MTGSPFNTNFFRIEGPAGSFTGSTQLCADATLGDSATATDDCIETDLFSVVGKLATRAGVEVTKAYYSNSGTGHMMDLFAFSEPGQNLVVSGSGIPQTKMREDATTGRYYARVYADGAPPADLAVTNKTDAPNSVDHVAAAMFGDKVHILSAVYSNDDHTLNVSSDSGDDSATMKLDGYAAVAPTVANGVSTWSIPNVNVPPSDVLVTSNKGGVDSEDVVITGAEDPSAQVVATITGDTNAVQVGQAVSLDGLASTGSITSYAWSVSPTTGATLTGTGSARTFTATAAGVYTVSMTVTGAGAGNTSTDTFKITVSSPSAPPVANAGPDQTGVVPTSTVTLDGTGSTFASTFAWTQTGGPAVTLTNAATANPTFVVPSATTSQTFTFSADDHRRQRHHRDRLGAGHDRPGRPGVHQRLVQAGRRRVAGPWRRPVLLGQQPGQRLLEQARRLAGPAGNHDADGRSRSLQLRLPAQERPRGAAAHGSRHRDGAVGAGR